jgi:hypothetical protein
LLCICTSYDPSAPSWAHIKGWFKPLPDPNEW